LACKLSITSHRSAVSAPRSSTRIARSASPWAT
jgi:hypothetical protein